MLATSASASTRPEPACSSAQLVVLASGSLAAAGNGSMAFDVVNRGASCRIDGYPSVTFLNAIGRAVDNRDFHNSSSMLFAEPKASMVTIARNGVATFGVSWGNNPVNDEACPLSANAVVELRSGVENFWGEVPIDPSPCGNYLVVTPIESGAWPRPNG